MMHRASAWRRPAALSPLAAVLMTLLVAMVAFTVDVAWIVSSRSELQHAADAAALAGVDALMDGYVQYQLAVNAGLPSDQLQTILNNGLSAATTLAQQYAGYNGAGGVSSLVLNAGDVTFGFTDASGNYNTTYSGFPNTISVTMRRDASANAPLGLFFAPVLGTSNTSLEATASATAMGGVLDGLSWPGHNIPVLPFTYDVNAWNTFVTTGLWPDGTQSLSSANSAPQLQIYPNDGPNSGNFSVLSLNNTSLGVHTVTWISSGMAQSDLNTLTSKSLLPFSKHSSSSWNWLGNPNYVPAAVLTANDYTGQVFLLPLFTPKNATSGASYQGPVQSGGSYYYNVTQMVGVRVMQAPAPGYQVIIQPGAVVDASMSFTSSAVPAGTTSYLMTTFTYPKLTR
jgi:Flp pilus assembly protein TadG